VLGPLVGAGERELEPVEERLHDAVAAIHRAADSLDRHVEVLEEVAGTLPALTESVTRLCDQLAGVLALATPVEAVERDIGRIGRIFRRRRQPAPVHLALTTPPSAPADGSRSEPR
jgi:hypothetical protein